MNDKEKISENFSEQITKLKQELSDKESQVNLMRIIVASLLLPGGRFEFKTSKQKFSFVFLFFAAFVFYPVKVGLNKFVCEKFKVDKMRRRLKAA